MMVVGVKRGWDPEGVFWCGTCVGGGDWGEGFVGGRGW